MLAISCLCIALLLLSCESDPTAPDEPDVPEIVLTIVPADTEIWSGETMLFTVQSSQALGEGVSFEWDFGMEQEVGHHVVAIRAADTVTHTFSKTGSRTIRVKLIDPAAQNGTVPNASLDVNIRTVTNTLTIEPAELLWDAGYEYTFTLHWGNRLPAAYRVRWDFGDGTTLERDGDVACSHSFEKPGVYRISAQFRSGVPDTLRGIANARVTVTAPTPGRYLRFEILDAELNYLNTRTHSTPYTVTEDALTWRCDSTLRWDGNRFSFHYQRMANSVYIGRYIAQEITVNGVLEDDILKNFEIRFINVSRGFGFDSLYQYAVLENLPADPAAPGTYSVTGPTAIYGARRVLDFYRETNSMSYSGTVKRERRLQSFLCREQSVLRVVIGHRR